MSGSKPQPPGEARSENAPTETHVSPERFARIREIFEAALERPAGEWAAYVAGACGGDAKLEKEVLAMLAADDAAGPTEVLHHPAARARFRAPPAMSSSAPDEGRFPAGANLAGRYRILGLLGRGGMGEVYRAFDAKLDQTVALKFLPESMARNPRLLERFRGEVRMARQVSHRNVCRVYDLGEFEDMPFLTMEYVDGEDLRGLLRRIGRLPGDKALEIARKLCAGLAAAHEKGILHRDLKPANIMIDGQGQVRIMDFGLAAVADAIPGADIRSGTPAYMAPEQLAGKEVTVQSDIYSLGLLLYEIFTGQPAHKGADRSATPPTATSVVKEIDPVVERVIERCLDPNPANRPESALALARMLPGGDPLAEALAAGDTPTPAMVASSDDVGKLPVWALSACMGFVVVALAVLMYWSGGSYLNATPTPYAPQVLEQRARDFIAEFGYPDPPADWDLRFETDVQYRDWAARNEDQQEARQLAEQGRPAPMLVTYSQSPLPMLPADPLGQISESDPARIPGWIDLTQDLRGRLTYFLAVPERGEKALPNPVGWAQLFEAAGLEIGRWKATGPQETPPVAFDAQAAWTGTYPGAPDIPLRIEAATWKGRPVFVRNLRALASGTRRPASPCSYRARAAARHRLPVRAAVRISESAGWARRPARGLPAGRVLFHHAFAGDRIPQPFRGCAWQIWNKNRGIAVLGCGCVERLYGCGAIPAEALAACPGKLDPAPGGQAARPPGGRTYSRWGLPGAADQSGESGLPAIPWNPGTPAGPGGGNTGRNGGRRHPGSWPWCPWFLWRCYWSSFWCAPSPAIPGWQPRRCSG